MSRDLFYHLTLERYFTVNHSGLSHIRNNKAITIRFQVISVLWYLATPFSISFLSNQTLINGHISQLINTQNEN